VTTDREYYTEVLLEILKKFWKELIGILLLHYLRGQIAYKDCTKLQNSTDWFRLCPNITEKFNISAIFKSFLKQYNASNETSVCP
jgi:hypothetical protein